MTANGDLIAEFLTTRRRDGRTRLEHLIDGDLPPFPTHTFEGRVPDPPYKIPTNGRTKPMTASTPIQTKARNAVADDIVDRVGLTVIDHERDNEGPRGGVSNRILAFATVDGAKVPVVVQVYADERIDELTEEFITRTEAERTRQDRYEEFLARQPIEATAAAIEPGGHPDPDQDTATA